MVCKSYIIDSVTWEILKYISEIASYGDLVNTRATTYVYDGCSFLELSAYDGHVEMDHSVGDIFPPGYWMNVEEIHISRTNDKFFQSESVPTKYTIDYTWIKYDSLDYTRYDGPKEILELPYVKEILEGDKPLMFTSTLDGKVTKIIRNANWAFNGHDELWDVRVINEDYVICDHMPSGF